MAQQSSGVGCSVGRSQGFGMASCVGGSHRRKVRIALAGVSIGVMAQAAAARDENADHAAPPHASEVARDSGEVQPSKPKASRRPKLVAGAAPITPVDPRYVQLGAQRADAVTLDELRVEGQGQGVPHVDHAER